MVNIPLIKFCYFCDTAIECDVVVDPRNYQFDWNIQFWFGHNALECLV